jgi:ketosteroid isomerase-like protein
VLVPKPTVLADRNDEEFFSPQLHSVYIITLNKLEGMPYDAYASGMRLLDDELAALKACIEAVPEQPPAPTCIVEGLYEGFRKRDMPKVFSLLSPDVEILQSEELPWEGRYYGHDDATAFFGKLGANLNSTLAIERIISAGESVVAVGGTEGTAKATSAQYRVPVAHVFTVRNGTIAQGEFYIDHPKMLEALKHVGP